MKNLLNLLKALAVAGVVIYLLSLVVFLVAFLHIKIIFQSIFYALLIAVNIWVVIKANKILNSIEKKQGIKYAIYYLLIGFLAYAFLNFGLCIYGISIH
jgi:hypothetical protein